MKKAYALGYQVYDKNNKVYIGGDNYLYRNGKVWSDNISRFRKVSPNDTITVSVFGNKESINLKKLRMEIAQREREVARGKAIALPMNEYREYVEKQDRECTKKTLVKHNNNVKTVTKKHVDTNKTEEKEHKAENLIHTILLFTTFGIGNVIYGLYKSMTNKKEVWDEQNIPF